MFLNELYSITDLTHSEDKLSAEIRLHAAHRLFEGHFPGMPVTPGVVQLQIVKELLEQHFQKKWKLKMLRSCKFLHVLNPNENPDVRISIQWRNEEFLNITASAESAATVFFKVQAIYL
jgi:3-hydroxyacyl-[acyl-carrier-protein] dehydratase